MIGSMLAHIVEGIHDPRASIERLLKRQPGVGDAALMVILAYCLQAALNTVMLGGAGAAAGASLVQHFGWMLMSLAVTFVIGMLIYVFGRMFGGVATREQSLVVAAWHSLVMTLLAPFLLIAVAQVEGETMPFWASLVVLVFIVAWIWLLANYTAAAHKFRSNWSVLGVIVGVVMLFSTILVALTAP